MAIAIFSLANFFLFLFFIFFFISRDRVDCDARALLCANFAPVELEMRSLMLFVTKSIFLTCSAFIFPSSKSSRAGTIMNSLSEILFLHLEN